MMTPDIQFSKLDAAYIEHETRQAGIRDGFYAAFREVTDQRGLPAKAGWRSDQILDRATRLLSNGVLPDLNKKGVEPEKAVAQIPASTLVLAVYAAASQEHTSWLGRDSRALRTFDQLHNTPFEQKGLAQMGGGQPVPQMPLGWASHPVYPPTKYTVGLLERDETKAWVAATRQDLTRRLQAMDYATR